MSTSMLYHPFGISGVKYLATDYSTSQVTSHAEMTTQSLQCPTCAGLCFKFRGKRIRRFPMILFGKKPCFLSLILHRVELLLFGIIKDVAIFLGVGWDTIKRIHKENLRSKYRKIPLEEIEHVSIRLVA